MDIDVSMLRRETQFSQRMIDDTDNTGNDSVRTTEAYISQNFYRKSTCFKNYFHADLVLLESKGIKERIHN